MRKFLGCAACAAALTLAANAADTAVPQKSGPAAPAKTQAAPKPAAAAAKAPAPAAKTPVPAAKTAPRQQTASRPAAPAAGVAKGTTAARRTATTGLPKRPTTTWRNRQAVPTPDRYKEIQEALATRGYLQPEDASGHWDQASIEALKKFQADQKLDSTGKLNSLSLIALGLGPKYEPSAAAPPAAPPPPPATPPGDSH